jgi:hypothetical protein
MANKTLAMLQVRRILQLLQNGKSKRQIARDLSISRNTIDDYETKYIVSGQSLYPSEGLLKENNPRYNSFLEKIPTLSRNFRLSSGMEFRATSSIRIVADCGLHSCQHTRKLKRATTLNFLLELLLFL